MSHDKIERNRQRVSKYKNFLRHQRDATDTKTSKAYFQGKIDGIDYAERMLRQVVE